MIFKKINFFILFFIIGNLAFADDLPVLSFANKSSQNDSVKGNLLNILPELLYGKLMEGKLVLWDSPKKQIKISAESLKNIETSSRTKFSESVNLFFYENWNIKKKEVEIKLIGLSFANRNDKGEDVSYGFVAYEDISDLLKKTLMPSGADGFYQITIDQKIKYKDYVYTVLQYGSQMMKKADSKKLIESTFKDRKLVTTSPVLKQEKMIEYSIEYTSRLEGEEVKNSKLFFRAVEDYLRSNEEVYYNMGGQKMSSYLTRTNFKVDRIEISEIWNKDREKVAYYPKKIRISVNGDFLEPINIAELMNWNMQLGFKTAEDFISEKKFYYVLFKINDQEIKLYDALKYQKALEEADWRNIISFVKHSEVGK